MNKWTVLATSVGSPWADAPAGDMGGQDHTPGTLVIPQSSEVIKHRAMRLTPEFCPNTANTRGNRVDFSMASRAGRQGMGCRKMHS